MPTPDPRKWLDTVFGNVTSLVDFFGGNQLAHDHMDAAILAAFPGAALRAYPLGSLFLVAPQENPDPGRGVKVPPEWLLAHQDQHVSEANIIKVAPPGDLTSYDLSDRDQFIAFMLAHAQIHILMNAALGLH